MSLWKLARELWQRKWLTCKKKGKYKSKKLWMQQGKLLKVEQRLLALGAKMENVEQNVNHIKEKKLRW